ncbi:hypothetical protein Q428_04235 [Fervidicella metallireducens AeB]|uniref:Uncharacterized protein n=1 Tax=Fervidicella metallireducens AeB TaxID=1403537 RepID=A0A017RX66_9CLOT|nr:hypothetical protein [Fervidicella metallireducens]EYE89171.1 hypothetical protein Q428_04235 [Fervidicella metallireducens AeB]
MNKETSKNGYPITEHFQNALIWPEGPKGRLDLNDTYEVSSIPEDPDTPMESVETLQRKMVMPKDIGRS